MFLSVLGLKLPIVWVSSFLFLWVRRPEREVVMPVMRCVASYAFMTLRLGAEIVSATKGG